MQDQKLTVPVEISNVTDPIKLMHILKVYTIKASDGQLKIAPIARTVDGNIVTFNITDKETEVMVNGQKLISPAELRNANNLKDLLNVLSKHALKVECNIRLIPVERKTKDINIHAAPENCAADGCAAQGCGADANPAATRGSPNMLDPAQNALACRGNSCAAANAAVCTGWGCGANACAVDGCAAQRCPLNACAADGCAVQGCGANGCVTNACAANGCTGQGCGANACAVAGCAAQGCPMNGCAVAGCAAQACGGNVCAGHGCAVDGPFSICGAQVCGGNICAIDGPLPCPVDFGGPCVVNVPYCPIIL